MIGIRNRVLLYSDCSFFAGSEKILASFLRSRLLRDRFEIDLAFNKNNRFIEGLLSELADVGLERFNIYPLSFYTGDDLLYRISTSTHGVFQTLRADYFGRIFLLLFKSTLITLRRIGVWTPLAFFSAWKLLKKSKPSVVFLNNGGYPGALSVRWMALMCGMLKIPAVMMIHNRAYPQRRFYEEFLDRWISKSLKKCITSSAAARSALIELRKFSDQQCVVLANTVTTPEVRKTRDEILNEHFISKNMFILVQVGLLTRRKGQEISLRALCKLRETDPQIYEGIHLLLVGDGEDMQYLRSLAMKEGLLDEIPKVTFCGTRSNYSDYISACDLFIHPSVESEDMPLVIYSAMELAKPILTTPVGGISEQVRDGIEGQMCAINSPTDLALKVLTLRRDSQQRAALSKAAKVRFTECFSYLAFEKRFCEFFDTLISEKESTG